MSSLNWNSVRDLNDINKIIEEGGNDNFEGLDNADKIINISKTEWGDYMVFWRQEVEVIPASKHGRIVDLDKVLDWLINEKRVFSMAMSAKFVNALSDAPVILEANNEEITG